MDDFKERIKDLMKYLWDSEEYSLSCQCDSRDMRDYIYRRGEMDAYEDVLRYVSDLFADLLQDFEVGAKIESEMPPCCEDWEDADD